MHIVQEDTQLSQQLANNIIILNARKECPESVYREAINRIGLSLRIL